MIAPSPLGLRPRWAVDWLRMQEILQACQRFTEARKVIPPEWLSELAELNTNNTNNSKRDER